MSEELIPNEEVKEPQPFIMTIKVDGEGRVFVDGPLSNKLLCYSMLEGARDAIVEWHEEQKKKRNVNNSGGLIHFARNGFKK